MEGGCIWLEGGEKYSGRLYMKKEGVCSCHECGYHGKIAAERPEEKKTFSDMMN